MVEHIVGDWKSFEFRMAEPSHYPGILRLMRENFYPDEPLCRNSGYDDAFADDLDKFVLGALQDNLSFVVLEKSTGKIAAARVTCLVWKGETLEYPPNLLPKTKNVIDILVNMSKEANLFAKYPQYDQFADYFMVCVGRDYRGHGLATEIYERSQKMLKAMGFPLVKCLFTSPITQGIARKRGFIEAGNKRLVDMTKENGEKLFPNAGEEDCAIFMYKELK